MSEWYANDSLSWGDALFLYWEREGMPQHVAGISIFEGVIPLEACTAFIESKLPLIPRYLDRVVAPPFNLGLPAWERDPHFDIRNHIRQIRLKRGTDTEIKAEGAKLLGRMMDRRRPLWDLTLLHDLKGKRTGVVARLHHCLADGIAGVGLMNVILDPKPVLHGRPRKKQPMPAAPPPRDAGTLLLDGLVSTCANLVERAVKAQAQALHFAGQMVAEGAETPIGELVNHLPELASAADPLPFNVVCRGPQKIAWAEMSLADIKAIKNACGTTVNDVALAVVTAAVRRYAELHGANVKGRSLRIMVPVNMRNGDNSSLGNHISLLPVTVPLDFRDPGKLLLAVHEKMEFLKRAHVAELVGLAGTLAGMMPLPFQAYAGPIASQLPIHPFNLVCTNVPGPQFPLYLLGHKMLSWYPFVPIGGNMALNCAILSYDGNVYFGFRGDIHAAPDLERVEEFLRISFAELKKAAGIKPRQRKRARARARATPPPVRAANRQPTGSSGDSASVPEVVPEPDHTPAQKPKAMAAGVGT